MFLTLISFDTILILIDSYPAYTWNLDARMIVESSTRSACMAGDDVCEIVTQMTSFFALQTICCKQYYAQFFPFEQKH